MEKLNKDILILTCLKLNDKDILSLALTNKKFYYILFGSNDLWLNKIVKNYDIRYFNYSKRFESHKNYYKFLKEKKCFYNEEKRYTIECYNIHEYKCCKCGMYVCKDHYDSEFYHCMHCYYFWFDYGI